jgi:hypothetical protein
MEPLNHDDDETLPNFIKTKHPKKGEKNKQRTRTKVEAWKKKPQRGKLQGGNGTTSTKTSTGHMKHIN